MYLFNQSIYCNSKISRWSVSWAIFFYLFPRFINFNWLDSRFCINPRRSFTYQRCTQLKTILFVSIVVLQLQHERNIIINDLLLWIAARFEIANRKPCWIEMAFNPWIENKQNQTLMQHIFAQLRNAWSDRYFYISFVCTYLAHHLM